MKKSLFNPLLLLAGLLVSNLSVAQVTPISGVVEPEISTAESPKWYTMMSSHLTASDRQNRFMKWDGSNLCTDQLTTPPTDAAYIWRLEKADGGDNYCVLVHSSGMRIVVPVEATAINNTMLEMSADEGAVWVLATSASTGQQQCADKQYCLDYTGISGAAYLNAADTSWDYGVTVYEMGTHQASGWFFYPAQYTPPTATKTVSVKSADSAKGSVSIEGKESTSVEVPETEALIVKATAADNYMFYRWVEEGTETVISYRHTYSYEGTEDKTLVAEFVEKDYPIISEETAIKNALAKIPAKSVDDVESCEVSYDDEKKLYTVSIINYNPDVHKNVFWEFYVDGYTGIGRGHEYDDRGDYGPVTIKFLTEQEAADIVLGYIEERGYPKSDMTVTVEAEEVEDCGIPVILYHIKAVHGVTEFESEIYADSKNPSVIRPRINHRLVKASKTGKYISEDIAKEIAVHGSKDFYTVVSCTLDESGEIPIYEVVTTAVTGRYIKKISAESGLVIEEKYE